MKLNKKTLSLLSLLIIPGILLIPLVTLNSPLILIPLSMCGIGGLCFGTLAGK
jgi:hypothetical protein